MEVNAQGSIVCQQYPNSGNIANISRAQRGFCKHPKGPLHAVVNTINQKCELEQVMYCGFQIVSDNQKAIVALRWVSLLILSSLQSIMSLHLA